MIKGFIINKFRGDVNLFHDGYALIETQTGWPGFGIAPWFSEAWKLPAEDAVDLEGARNAGALHIVCLCLSRIANFDDLDPLAQEPGVRLTMLGPGRAIPGDADLVILPGTKSTRGDLAFLRAQGWDLDLIAHHRRGGRILGICGGYQMLGATISDPDGIEGAPGTSPGLGLLQLETVMTGDKRLTEVRAQHAASGQAFSGYEIHIGRSEGADRARPFARIEGQPEGAVSADGRVSGSYLHGMFADDGFRRAWLAEIGAEASDLAYDQAVEAALEALADHLEAHLDVPGLLALAR
jgi:adenosylcobyric acid synthase